MTISKITDDPKMAPRWPQMSITRLPWRPSFFLGPAECAERLNTAGEPARLAVLIPEASSASSASKPNCLLGAPRILPAPNLPWKEASFFATFFQPFLVPFFYRFLDQFRLQNGLQNCSKMHPKIDNFVVHFRIPFLLGFGALWVPLGSLLGPPKALLGGLWTPKTLKN